VGPQTLFRSLLMTIRRNVLLRFLLLWLLFLSNASAHSIADIESQHAIAAANMGEASRLPAPVIALESDCQTFLVCQIRSRSYRGYNLRDVGPLLRPVLQKRAGVWGHFGLCGRGSQTVASASGENRFPVSPTGDASVRSRGQKEIPDGRFHW
jgi:hypothetical protein